MSVECKVVNIIPLNRNYFLSRSLRYGDWIWNLIFDRNRLISSEPVSLIRPMDSINPSFFKKQSQKPKNYLGFTLVELIVVITILVILGTIAFTSLSGFSGSARDSSRISDLANISSSLDIVFIKTGAYPMPDNSFSVTYSGWVVWYQGTVGEKVMNVMGSVGAKISKKPSDPLNAAKNYTYSKLDLGNTYQLQTDWEGDNIAYSSFSIATAASGNPSLAYIKGNYNGVVAKTRTGGITYVLAMPSIVTTQSGTSLDILTLSGKMLLHGQTNSGGIAYIPRLVFSSGSLPSNDAERILFASGTALAYSGTVLAGNPQIQPFITALASGNTWSLMNLGGNAVVNWLGGTWIITPPAACIWSLVIANATVSNTGGLSIDTTYQTALSGNGCYFLCKANYSGANCQTYIPPLIVAAECLSAGWFWVADTTTGPWDGYCISPRIGDFADGGLGAAGGISWNGWGEIWSPSYSWWPTGGVVDGIGGPVAFMWQIRKLDTPVSYTCKALWTAVSDFDITDTIVGRMKWLVTNKMNLAQLQNIDWITNATPPNFHSTPALVLSDCIDWVKNLGTDIGWMLYSDYTVNRANTDQSGIYPWCDIINGAPDLDCIIYQNRQHYLLSWTKQTWSHLPSAFTSISSGNAGSGNGEYAVACLANKFWPPLGTNQTSENDQDAEENIWLSSIGAGNGSMWGNAAWISSTSNCATDTATTAASPSGLRTGNISARFVVRP